MRMTLMAFVLFFAMYAPAQAFEISMDELVPAEEVQQMLDESEVQGIEANMVRPHVTCYARDRWGNTYAASHPHAGKAQSHALRQCQRASRSACYNAGCYAPQRPAPAPRPYPYPRRGD